MPKYAPIGVQLTGVAGPLARRVADLRAAFAVVTGPTWRDPWTVPAPLPGLPAVAVPVSVGDGLPQAVQVIGPRYREDLCLDAAAAIEERRGTITPIDPR